MPKPLVTADRLRHLLAYDAETGLFTRRISVVGRNGRAGAIAGTPHKGYVQIQIDRRPYKAHRLAWLYMTGEWPAAEVDHRNTVKSDNRWDNLREADRTLNAENQRRAHRDSQSSVLGVTKNHKRWMANITINGRQQYLGTFDTPQIAGEAYLAAKRQHHVGCTL